MALSRCLVLFLLLWCLVAFDHDQVNAFSLPLKLPTLFHKREPPPPPPEEQKSVRYGLSVRRNEVLDAEEKIRMGFVAPMTNEEKMVNERISDIKDAELNEGFKNSAKYLASQHFFRVKERIEQSEVFKLIQMMPKGALLHGHNTAMVSSEWFIRNVTYRSGIMMYTTDRNVMRFTFKQPKESNNWRYVADLRKSAANVEAFDKQLEAQINLYTPQPEIDYPDIDVVWKKFQNMFETVRDAIRYYPVYVDYHTQMLQEMVDDNVMYAEIRTGAGELYDVDGRIYSSVETVQTLQNVVENFRARHPNFFGIKLIYAGHRGSNPNDYSDVNTFRELQ